MKTLPYPLLALLLVLSLPAVAKDETPPPYFDPATVDFKALLPAPPTDDSPATRKEIDLILEKQKSRTPEEVARIKAEAKLKVDVFQSVLGPWFDRKLLPVTFGLFDKIAKNTKPVVVAAKKSWNRPRPFKLDSQVQPPIDLPTDPAYPSGHSTQGNLWALVLAEVAPDKKEQVLARGRLIGEDRVIGGVHYPSDIAAGEKLAKILFEKLEASPAFQADLAKAKAELAAVRTKP